MKIVHIVPLYYPSIGGSQLHMAALSEQLAALGEEVVVYTANAMNLEDLVRPPAKDKRLPAHEKINGVTVKRFNVNARLRRFIFDVIYKIRGGYRLVNWLLGDFQEYWRHGPITLGMFAALLKDKPDLVVVSNDYPFQGIIGYFGKKWLKKPFVFIPITHTFLPWAQHPARKKLLQSADLLIAATEFEKNFFIAQGLDAEKIRVNVLGIHYREWAAAPKTKNVREIYGLGRDPVVGYVGRKCEGKGVEHLIQAMRIVWKKFPQARLLLAGKAEEGFQKVIEAEMNQLEAHEKKQVVLVYDLPEIDKKSFYAALDAMVMVSHIDSFGLVYLEAWATEVPVIAAKGTPQESFIEEGKNGFLVEYGNPASIAQGIEKLLSDQCLRQEMGDYGNFKVESVFNTENYTREIHRHYKQLLAKRGIRNK